MTCIYPQLGSLNVSSLQQNKEIISFVYILYLSIVYFSLFRASCFGLQPSDHTLSLNTPLESAKMSFSCGLPLYFSVSEILHRILRVWWCEVPRSVDIGQCLILRTVVTDTAPCSQIISRIVASQGCDESRYVLAEDHYLGDMEDVFEDANYSTVMACCNPRAKYCKMCGISRQIRPSVSYQI